IHRFVTCSLVKSLTLIVDWPHILFGHRLTRICLVETTLVASQMSCHLCSKLCPPGHVGDTRGSFPNGHGLPLAGTAALPHPPLSFTEGCSDGDILLGQETLRRDC
uniref:Uncharacterized protein n=1 Tax=Catagonus wagneri TaxID=51154 RepID=A0A8C3W3V2_9CETA